MSSSRMGANPVQSALRWPSMNLSSATLKSSSIKGLFRCSLSLSTRTSPMTRRWSKRLFQIFLLVLVHVLLAAKLLPSFSHLVATCLPVGPVGVAPNDILLVIGAEQ